MKLAKKVVIVTGGASGIGRAIVDRMASEGAYVVAADIREPHSLPSGVRALVADVSTDSGVCAMIRNVEENEGQVDIFVGNAGVAYEMDTGSTDSDWARMMDINLMAHVRAARYLLPDMARRAGTFVITASAAGLLNEVGSVGYGVSKHAALGLAEWLAFHHANEGLKVHCICPEGVLTNMIEYAPYLRERAVTPETVADNLLKAMQEGRFMVTTHDSTLKGLGVKATNYDKFIQFMSQTSEARRSQG